MERAVKLSEVLDLEALNDLFGHFFVSIGLDVALCTVDGTVLLSRRADGAVCNAANGAQFCKKSLAYGAEMSKELGEPYIFSCPCGLIMCSSPIVFEGELLGSIVCGPVMLWEADEYAKAELNEKLKQLGVEGEPSVKALECMNMTSAAHILFTIVKSLIKEHGRFLEERAKRSRQQARIGEILTENSARYPFETEKELISFVRAGKETEAKRMLNRFLGEIFTSSGGAIDTIKASLFELLAFLSRAAVDEGAPLSKAGKIVNSATKIINSGTDFDELCSLTSNALDEFLDIVYTYGTKVQPDSSDAHLASATEYIKKNYSDDLKLGQVANAVFVSSFYLSHLFRQKLNTTFSNYLCKVRIDCAKELLRDKSVKIQEAASYAGFSDPNYFAKVFKKQVRMTPKEYKAQFV